MDPDAARRAIDANPQGFLREVLSGQRKMIFGLFQDTNSDCSMTGSADESIEAPTYEPEEVGRGQCGRVIRHGDNCVLKIAHLDKEEDLHNDFEMHTRCQTAFLEVKTPHHINIHIPALDRLAKAKDEVNGAMIKTLCPPPKEGIDLFLARPDNKHCLPRIHLRRRGLPRQERVDDHSLTLRNFSLQLDDLVQLDVNAYDFAHTIGQALAVLHWKVGIDGAGVEFVLGQVPVAQSESNTALADTLSKAGPQVNIIEGRIGLWLIDFDRCKDFTHDEEGLQRLLDAYADAYFPTPHTCDYIDARVWHYFREAYLEMSEVLIASCMPAEFFHRIQTQKIMGELGDVMGGLEGLSI